ncbi:Syntaxin-2 Epimorphin [Triplophysa tibetana]|uniref:Syntaxin-2 Epimorphin n=1 Tax=Triplophysa tibetana TaxID=1572043 RepID=A0A5A9PE43_9TELE|nr:Syntaxin-2 Epimorphin [Triplophysa tibetana]
MKDRLADLTPSRSGQTAPAETNALLEEFLHKVDEVQKLMNRISHSVDEVSSRHHTILTEINPSTYVREELEQLNNDIRRTADDMQAKLKDLDGSFAECENANNGSVYFRIQTTQHTALSLRFSEIMNAYNQELLSFRKNSKERIQRQLEIKGRVITEEETEVLLQNNNTSVFTLDTLLGSNITGQTLNEIESRRKDILCLEASIRELNNMFIDIAMLVSRQGEMANNIEKAVMKAGNYVEHGKENIKEAGVYKNSWRIRLPPLRRCFKSKAKAVTTDGS